MWRHGWISLGALGGICTEAQKNRSASTVSRLPFGALASDVNVLATLEFWSALD